MPEHLPEKWVKKILDKLLVRYGNAYLTRVACIENEQDLWDDWAEVLAGYQANPGAIAWALENLPPDQPPTAGAFRELCRRAPAAPVPRLEAPAPADNPALRQAAKAVAIKAQNDSKAWAYALRDREIWQAKNPRLVSRHEALTPAQRRMWRSALGLSDFAPAEPRNEAAHTDEPIAA